MIFGKARFSRFLSEMQRFFGLETWLQRIAALVNAAALGGIFHVFWIIFHSSEPKPVTAFLPFLFAIGALLCLNIFIFMFGWRMRAKWHALEKNSECDNLTGALNWACFEEILDDEIRRAGRYRYPVTLCLLDLDGFGSYNENFGRHKGDELLRKFSRFLQATIRFSDTMGRYQNDEFCLLLPHTDLVRAEKFINRLLRQADEANGSAFSAGITPYRVGENRAQLVMRAKAALDQAKRDGQKKVSCFIGGDDQQTVVQF